MSQYQFKSILEDIDFERIVQENTSTDKFEIICPDYIFVEVGNLTYLLISENFWKKEVDPFNDFFQFQFLPEEFLPNYFCDFKLYHIPSIKEFEDSFEKIKKYRKNKKNKKFVTVTIPEKL